MIVHTLIYRFPSSVTEGDQEEFFTAMKELLDRHSLIKGFDYKRHMWLPADKGSRGITASAIAAFTTETIDDLKTFSETPEVYDFTTQWKQKLQFEAAYANHEPLSV
ncbi:Dabb family protein [Nonomuraea sp. SYSU D8015]|uniref:Dabb family protein n=1 Tax=Nonomuraea sp. SYSU D8015 TaxID=2593644 RepID=UPI0016601BD0|nr:Dabb family protein [Nonomuraea sp. SYSU D8015]